MNHNNSGNGNRPDISLAERVFIAVDLITRRRYFGKITNTARSLGLSRQTIYDLMGAAMANLAALLGVTKSPLFRGKDTDEEFVVAATLLGEALSTDAVRGLAADLTGCHRSPEIASRSGALEIGEGDRPAGPLQRELLPTRGSSPSGCT